LICYFRDQSPSDIYSLLLVTTLHPHFGPKPLARMTLTVNFYGFSVTPPFGQQSQGNFQ